MEYEIENTSSVITHNQSAVTLNLTLKPSLADHRSHTHQDSTSELAEHIIYTYVILGIALFGIAGNVLNLIILTNKSMSKSMERMELSAHIGLVALAVSDMLYCIMLLPKSLIGALAPPKSRFTTYRKLTFVLLYSAYGDAFINVFGMSSTWLTVTMAFSRYLAICHPFKARLLIGKRFAKISTSLVFLLSFLFNIPRFLEHPISDISMKGKTVYWLGIGCMNRTYSYRYNIYMWCYFVICISIPFMVLVFSNVHLIREVRSAPKRIQRRTSSKCSNSSADAEKMQLLTLTLVLIVVFYIVFVTPAEVNKFINDLMETSYGSYNLVIAITNTLETFNFAFNFILYCAINSHFRRVIKETVCKKRCVILPSQQQSSCCCYCYCGDGSRHDNNTGCQYTLTEVTASKSYMLA